MLITIKSFCKSEYKFKKGIIIIIIINIQQVRLFYDYYMKDVDGEDKDV